MDTSALFRPAGGTAFVAGAYGGLGEAIARALAQVGVAVALGGRDAAKLEALADSIAKAGGTGSAHAFDASDVPSIRDAVDRAAQAMGGVDFLINAVGLFEEERLLDATPESFDRVTAVNYRAAMFLGQAVARAQVAAGRGGRHVHLLSVRARLALRDRGYASYAGSKGGMLMLVKQHAVELAPHGITVNGVAPTVVRTPMAEHWFRDAEVKRRMLERIPLGRVAEFDDVTAPVLFFLAKGAAFLTGQVLYVDGGITASQ
jgi:gluconate 5-dehydrogenase